MAIAKHSGCGVENANAGGGAVRCVVAADRDVPDACVDHQPADRRDRVGGRRGDQVDRHDGLHLLAFDIADDGSLSGRRTWAEGIGPDGICLDAEGAIWTSSQDNECVRVAEGGQILDRIHLDRACFATMLGGNDRRTLFMMANRFLGPDKFDQMLAERTGQVLIVEAPAPGAGWP